MQGWVVGGAWLFAVIFALVLFGFAAYELNWKARRLQGDRVKLEALVAQLSATGADLQASAERARNAQRSARSGGPATG
jgi:hypothetical protein